MSWQVLNMRPFDADMGGNGDVFVGERSDTGEKVVVKYLRERHDPKARHAFLREIKVLARKIHDRIVPILAANGDAERPYYVMPFFDGGSLTKHAGRLDHGRLRSTARQIAEAFVALHAQEIAHGDIKPDNILMTRGGDLRVADPLGNGNGCTVLYSANHGGTPGYWAPEVAARSPISKASDVYSFGATLYHLATGRRPRDGQSMDPWAVGSMVPRVLRDLILKCCDRDPSRRLTMAQVAETLVRPPVVTQETASSDSDNWRDLGKFAAVAGCIVLAIGLVAAIADS